MIFPDVIKWLDDLFCTMRNGRGTLITFQTDSSWAPVDVEKLLRRFGVKVYGRRYADKEGHAGLTVRNAQARYADGLLRGRNVNVTSRVLSKPIRPSRDWGAPATPQGVTGALLEVLDGSLPARPRQRSRSRSRRRR